MTKDSLASKVSVVVFSRILTAIIDWSVLVIVVNLITDTELGILSFLLVVYEIAKNIATLGFPESIFYYFEKLAKNLRKAFAIQTTVILFITASIAAIGILVGEWLVPYFLTEFTPENVQIIQEYLPFIALIVVLEVPTWPVHNILLAIGRQREAGWYQIITSIFSFSAIVVPLWLGYPFLDVIYGLLIYATIRFIGSFIWVSLVIPKGPIRTREVSIKEQVEFSVPLGISSLVSQFNKNIDKLVVLWFFSETVAANYQVGANEIPILRVIPFAVGSVLISRYVNFSLSNKKEELLSLWHRSIEKVAALIIPLVILSVVLAEEIVPILYEGGGVDYSRAIIPFQIYNLIILIRVAHYGSMLQAFGDTKGVLRLSVTLLLLNLVLSIPATYLFGIVGTAAATFVANFINWYFTLKKIGGHLQIPFYKVLPLIKYFRILFLSLIIAIPVFYWKENTSSGFETYEVLLISSTAFIVVYLCLGTVFRILSKSDWKLFFNAITLKFFWGKY